MSRFVQTENFAFRPEEVIAVELRNDVHNDATLVHLSNGARIELRGSDRSVFLAWLESEPRRVLGRQIGAVE